MKYSKKKNKPSNNKKNHVRIENIKIKKGNIGNKLMLLIYKIPKPIKWDKHLIAIHQRA